MGKFRGISAMLAGVILLAAAPVSSVYAEEFFRDTDYVTNNGSKVVGYKGNIYYWKYGEGSVETGGMLENFYVVDGVNSQLISRSAEDGTEKVILEDVSAGDIYFCGDNLYYDAYSGYGWTRCNLNGEVLETYEADLRGVDANNGYAVFYDYTTGYRIIKNDGSSTIVPMTEANTFIGIHDGIMYYGINGQDTRSMDIYQVTLESGEYGHFGSFRLANGEDGYGDYLAISDILVRDDGIYFCAGTYAGTGAFFANGGIFRINYAGGINEVLNTTQYSISYPKISYQISEGGDKIYFSCAEAFSNVGYWDSWMSSDVYSVNLGTGEIVSEDYTICNISDVLPLDGGIWTRSDESGELRQVLSAEAAASLGYAGIGEGNETSEQVFVDSLDIVGRTAYFTITRITPSEEYSLGWRTGFVRDRMRLYAVPIGTDQVTLLHEY